LREASSWPVPAQSFSVRMCEVRTGVHWLNGKLASAAGAIAAAWATTTAAGDNAAKGAMCSSIAAAAAVLVTSLSGHCPPDSSIGMNRLTTLRASPTSKYPTSLAVGMY